MNHDARPQRPGVWFSGPRAGCYRDLVGLTDRLRAAITVLAALMAGCLDSPDDGSDPPPPGNLLVNSAFEDGIAGWTFDGTVELGTTEELGLPVSESGPNVALLGREDNEVDRVSQDVVVPIDAHALALTGLQCLTTYETGGQAYDRLTIFLEAEDGESADVLLEKSNLQAMNGSCDWLPFEVATEDHAGETLRFVIEVVMDPDVVTLFAVDGLALTAGP